MWHDTCTKAELTDIAATLKSIFLLTFFFIIEVDDSNNAIFLLAREDWYDMIATSSNELGEPNVSKRLDWRNIYQIKLLSLTDQSYNYNLIGKGGSSWNQLYYLYLPNLRNILLNSKLALSTAWVWQAVLH